MVGRIKLFNGQVVANSYVKGYSVDGFDNTFLSTTISHVSIVSRQHPEFSWVKEYISISLQDNYPLPVVKEVTNFKNDNISLTLYESKIHNGYVEGYLSDFQIKSNPIATSADLRRSLTYGTEMKVQCISITREVNLQLQPVINQYWSVYKKRIKDNNTEVFAKSSGIVIDSEFILFDSITIYSTSATMLLSNREYMDKLNKLYTKYGNQPVWGYLLFDSAL